MWYNSITNQLQSNTPWDGYLSPAMIAELYQNWTQVAVGFVPPILAPTKQQQFASVNAQYAPQLQGILTAVAQNQAMGNTATITTLQATYLATQSAWKTALLAVNNPTTTTTTTTATA